MILPTHETYAEFRDRMRARDLRVQLTVAALMFAAMLGVALLCWIG